MLHISSFGDLPPWHAGPTSLCVPRRARADIMTEMGRHHGGGGMANAMMAGRHQGTAGCHQGTAGRHQGTTGRHQGTTGRHQRTTGRHQGTTGRHQGTTGRHVPPSRHQSAHELTLPKCMYLKQANGLWHFETTRQQHDPKGCGMPKQGMKQGQEKGKPSTWPP